MSSEIKADKWSPASGTAGTIGDSGDTFTIPSGVTLANAGSVTGLPASAISSGTIATARLGSGTASSSTILYGDQTYKTAPSAGLVPVAQSSGTSGTANVIVNGWITDTYENYVMDYYFNVATSVEAISMTLYDASGNISSGNEYSWSHIGIDGDDGSTETLYNSSQNAFRLCHGANDDSARLSVTGRMIWLHPRLSGKRTTILHSMRMLNASAHVWTFNGALEFKASNALTGFYCNSTSGDIDTWGVRCYGIVNS